MQPRRRLALWGACAVLSASPTIAAAQPGVASVQLSKSSVTGGAGVSIDITLDAAAPGFGQNVTLSYSTTLPLGQAPKVVTVPGGQHTLKVAITTVPVASTVTLAVAASIGNSAKGAQLLVTSPEVTSASLSRMSVQGGDSLSLTVNLDGDAPTGGLPMSLTFVPPIMGLLPPPNTPFAGCASGSVLSGACNPWAEPPPPQSLTFEAGTRQLKLALLTPAVRQTRSVTVRASLGASRSLALEVRQPRVKLLEIRRVCHGGKITAATGPGTVYGVVRTEDRVSKDGAFATVTSGSALMSVPSTVELTDSTNTGAPGNPLEGQLGVPGVWVHSGCFPIAIPAVTTPTTVSVTAAAGGQALTARLNLTPLTVAELQAVPASLHAGQRLDLHVRLSGVVGAGGVKVRLTSSHPSIVPLPAVILAPPGDGILSIPVEVGSPPGEPGTSTAVVLTAELGGQVRTATVTVVR